MTRLTHRVQKLVFVALLLVTAAGCARKSINHVLADPSRYRIEEVTVSGRVVDSYSIGPRGVYLVEDGSGRLWVASDEGVPARGARVKVTGTVRSGFNLGALQQIVRVPFNGVVLVESSHRAR